MLSLLYIADSRNTTHELNKVGVAQPILIYLIQVSNFNKNVAYLYRKTMDISLKPNITFVFAR